MRTIIFSRVAALVAFALVGTAARAADGEKSFVYEGYTYTYTVAKDAGGRMVIAGHRLPGNQDFHLVVDKGRVSGRSGDAPVSFRVAEARGAAAGIAPVPGGSMAALSR